MNILRDFLAFSDDVRRLQHERDKAWAKLRIVSQARHEQWPADDPRWEPLDDALGLSADPNEEP